MKHKFQSLLWMHITLRSKDYKCIDVATQSGSTLKKKNAYLNITRMFPKKKEKRKKNKRMIKYFEKNNNTTTR